MRKFHTRLHPRWKRHDYRLSGIYFVTTNTFERAPLLGELRRGECDLSPFGQIVRDIWRRTPERFPGVELDAFVVMPDHVHALLMLPERPESEAVALTSIVGWAKSRSAHAINGSRGTPGARIWHTSFHDRILRDPEALHRVRRYIENNPRRACRHRVIVGTSPRARTSPT